MNSQTHSAQKQHFSREGLTEGLQHMKSGAWLTRPVGCPALHRAPQTPCSNSLQLAASPGLPPLQATSTDRADRTTPSIHPQRLYLPRNHQDHRGAWDFSNSRRQLGTQHKSPSCY